jgi:gluconolactonase
MEERMRTRHLGMLVACAVLLAVPVLITNSIAQTPPVPATPPPPAPQMPPSLPPAYVSDLMTAQGAQAYGAQWRAMEARIVETKPIPGAISQYKTTYDISPKAGDTNFDDSKWPAIDAKDLAVRRTGGHVAFVWYRANLTIPAKVGEFDTTGAKAVLSVLVDDYAEVWINGQMPRRSGYPSPATIQGLNMPNRVVLSDSVKPGDRFQVAIFGINGPISVAPANTVWFREAKLEFYR